MSGGHYSMNNWFRFTLLCNEDKGGYSPKRLAFFPGFKQKLVALLFIAPDMVENNFGRDILSTP